MYFLRNNWKIFNILNKSNIINKLFNCFIFNSYIIITYISIFGLYTRVDSSGLHVDACWRLVSRFVGVFNVCRQIFWKIVGFPSRFYGSAQRTHSKTHLGVDKSYLIVPKPTA